VRLVAAALGLVGIGVVAVGWLQSPDHITAAEAVAAAESAYAAAGLRGAVVDPHPDAGEYAAVTGHEPIDVWETVATLDGGTVQLWLSRADGESVFLDDRAPDGGSQLLTDSQFQQLADHYENPAIGRQVRRNLVLTLAAALVMLVGLGLSLVRRRPAEAPAASSPERPPRSSPLRATPLQSSPPRSAPPTAPLRTTPLRATTRRSGPIRARQETP
jgi:hypothetical protein